MLSLLFVSEPVEHFVSEPVELVSEPVELPGSLHISPAIGLAPTAGGGCFLWRGSRGFLWGV